MNVLDDAINVYEQMAGLSTEKTSPAPFTVQRIMGNDDDDENLYDDAFSLSSRQEADNVNPLSEPDSMNGHMHRGLPPTPTHMGIDGGRPPPCPREMYSQGMYACIEDQGEYRRQAPPPPKRNPDTRLSTASVSSNSSATYEELHVEEAGAHFHHQQQPHQQQYHQQQYHQQQPHQNMSPRHAAPGSPQTRSKFHHEPQSPSHAAGNRPFSYGAAVLSPKLNYRSPANGAAHMPHTNQNGQSETAHPQVLYNYQYDEAHSSPAAAYGKHDFAFHPQPHRPPPHNPPPPPPPGGVSSHDNQPPKLPQSPKMQRHSVTTIAGSPQNPRAPASPRMAQKFSQRSKSVPNNPDDEMHMPAPPPPLPLRDNYTVSAAHHNRAPSPPLPPPPPELLESPISSRELPPLPGSQSAVPQSVPYQKSQGLPNTPVPVPPVGVPNINYPHQNQHAPPPPPPPVNTIPQKRQQSLDEGSSGDIRRGSNSDGLNGPYMRGSPAIAMTTPPQTSREGSPLAVELMNALSKVQLKKTGFKPEEQLPQREQSPPPPPPPEAQTLPPKQLGTPTREQTPPTATSPQQNQVSPAVSIFEQRVESISNNNRPENINRNKGDTSKNSNMSVCIDDIDLSEVPGYTPITKSTPIWKRDMIEKKNQEKIEEYIKRKEREKAEAEKWKNVPEWKRKLMMEKEREKMKMTEEEQIKAKEAEEEKRARQKEQQEMQKKMEEELQSVPAWKREIMMKKGGAIKNWGDERENINKQPGEEGYEPPENDDDEYENNVPPPQQSQPAAQQPKQSQKQVAQPVKQKPKESPATPPKARMSLDETRLEEEWESLPLWKREILMKRGGAPSNWGDEREVVNEESIDH